MIRRYIRDHLSWLWFLHIVFGIVLYFWVFQLLFIGVYYSPLTLPEFDASIGDLWLSFVFDTLVLALLISYIRSRRSSRSVGLRSVIRRLVRIDLFITGYLIGLAICEPKVRLGRRRHDGYCDKCGDRITEYAGEHIDFEVTGEAFDDLPTLEKVRVLWRGLYRRICFACYCDEEGGGS